MQEKTNPQASSLPRPLRMFYGVGEFGQQLSVLTLNLYLLYFYTNVLGISGKAAGILMLVARIWDAINDPMMGMIIDNTHSKHGKCRPYLLYCAVPAGLFLFLTFFAPNLSNTGKLVWAYVTYIGQGMLYTATGISYTSLMSRISDKPMDRVALNQSRAFISMFAAIVISSLTLKLIEGVGGGNERLGFMLDAVGYDETLTIQSAAVKSGLFNTAIFVPLTVFAIVFCLMLVYRQYEKKLPQVRAELAEKRAAAAAAEAGE